MNCARALAGDPAQHRSATCYARSKSRAAPPSSNTAVAAFHHGRAAGSRPAQQFRHTRADALQAIAHERRESLRTAAVATQEAFRSPAPCVPPPPAEEPISFSVPSAPVARPPNMRGGGGVRRKTEDELIDEKVEAFGVWLTQFMREHDLHIKPTIGEEDEGAAEAALERLKQELLGDVLVEQKAVHESTNELRAADQAAQEADAEMGEELDGLSQHGLRLFDEEARPATPPAASPPPAALATSCPHRLPSPWPSPSRPHPAPETRRWRRRRQAAGLA